MTSRRNPNARHFSKPHLIGQFPGEQTGLFSGSPKRAMMEYRLRVVFTILALLFFALFVLFLALYISVPKYTFDSPNYPVSGNLVLEWTDEFNGRDVDLTKWTSQQQTGRGSGNGDRHIYVSLDEEHGSNFTFIRDGKLVLRAEATTGTIIPGVWQYFANSSKIFSKNMCFYGYTEVRAKAPQQNYVWPAIWFYRLVTANNQDQVNVLNIPGAKYPEWPRAGEIDLFELFGTYDPGAGNSAVAHNILSKGPDFWGVQATLEYIPDTLEPLVDTYHTYGLLWTPEELVFIVDATVTPTGTLSGGTVTLRVPNSKWGAVSPTGNDDRGDDAPFDQPMPITMNIAVMGTSFGQFSLPQNPPNDMPDLPAEFEIDFVRYYKFDGAVNTLKLPGGIRGPVGKSVTSNNKRDITIPLVVPPHGHVDVYNIGNVYSSLMMPLVMAGRNVTEFGAFLKDALLAELAENDPTHFMDSEEAMAALYGNYTPSARKRSVPRSVTNLELAWCDEFTDRILNRTNWDRIDLSPGQLDPNGVASSTRNKRNAYISQETSGDDGDGVLVIRALKELNRYETRARRFDDTLKQVAPCFGAYCRNSFFFPPFEVGAFVISSYTTGEVMTTQPVVDYGYLEIRAKIPVIDSLHVKIDLVRGTNSKEPGQGAIVPRGFLSVTQQDGIFNPTSNTQQVAFGGPPIPERTNIIRSFSGQAIANRDDWHVYGLERCPDGTINWYVDASVVGGAIVGTPVHTVTSAEYATRLTDGTFSDIDNSPFDVPLFLRMGVYPGGAGTGYLAPNTYDATGLVANYPGATLLTDEPSAAVFNDVTLRVDYVRFYKIGN